MKKMKGKGMQNMMRNMSGMMNQGSNLLGGFQNFKIYGVAFLSISSKSCFNYFEFRLESSLLGFWTLQMNREAQKYRKSYGNNQIVSRRIKEAPVLSFDGGGLPESKKFKIYRKGGFF